MEEKRSGKLSDCLLLRNFSIWKGKIGSWHEELNESQSKRIIDHHRIVMQRFGYLSTNDEIVF